MAALSLAMITACGAPNNTSASSTTITPEKPGKPIALTILDGGGDLKGGGQSAIDAFVKANPDLVSSVTYQTAAATDVAGKIKAQQSGGHMDISLVLGGGDVLGAGEDQKLFQQQLDTQVKSLPDLSTIQDDARSNIQRLANGYGLLVNFDQNGPFLDYNPTAVTAGQVPTTPQTLLDWAKANKGKFSYAQPANSGSGRAFIQALPYLLGDSDPSDPADGWTKTWAYLQELGKYVNSYPASSSLLAQQFGSGQLDLIPTVLSHDIANRKAGTWPANTGIALFQNEAWINDGHFAMIPNGVSAQTLYVALKLESSMVTAEAQRARLTTGVLTTANKDATIVDSGSDVTAFVQQWGRPDFFPNALKTGASRPPLAPSNLQKAFDLWQRNVGAKVGE